MTIQELSLFQNANGMHGKLCYMKVLLNFVFLHTASSIAIATVMFKFDNSTLNVDILLIKFETSSHCTHAKEM